MKWITSLWIFFLGGLVQAGDANVPDKKIIELASTLEWHALVYYQKTWSGGFLSEIDDSRFFLSVDGKTSPRDELSATIEAFTSPIQSVRVDAKCKFPARYQWAAKIFPDIIGSSDIHCAELDGWKATINSDSVALIFPSAYLDSPSSMFGHTLLRFDRRGQSKSTEILAYTVNYAATKDPEDSELRFVYRGLVGGYPGDVTMLPYYMKLKEYKDMESRDIWEYKLNLSEAETDFLLDVIWEVKDKRIDYFFFTENCSYRIVSFLNAVRPEYKLMSQFGLSAIPLDTVRVLKQAGFIEEIHYRPSVRTAFDNTIKQLTKDEQDWVYGWATGAIPFDANSLPSTENGTAALLDSVFQYSRMTSLSKINLRDMSFKVLKARKDVEQSSSLKPVDQPQYSDEYGHESRMLEPSLGHAYRQNYIGLTLRPAYHDKLDPPIGYPRGATLKFGELNIRYYETDRLLAESLDLVSITSIKPRNRFFKPMSWMVKLGGQRYDYRGKRIFAADVKGLLGPAYPLGSNSYIYAFSGADFRVSAGYDKGYNVDALAELGVNGRATRGQWQIKLNAETSILDDSDFGAGATGRYVFNMGVDRTISVEANRRYSFGGYDTSVSVAAGIFF